MHLFDTSPAVQRAKEIQAVQMHAQQLIDYARSHGLVVTITLKSGLRWPWATTCTSSTSGRPAMAGESLGNVGKRSAATRSVKGAKPIQQRFSARVITQHFNRFSGLRLGEAVDQRSVLQKVRVPWLVSCRFHRSLLLESSQYEPA